MHKKRLTHIDFKALTEPTTCTKNFFLITHLSIFYINEVVYVKILCKNMDGINFFIRAKGSKFWGKWGSGIKITARK